MNKLFRLLLPLLVGTLPLCAAASENVDVTIAAARQAAHDDKNAESARLFEQAIAAAPERRIDLLPELADQLTYSGKSYRAVPLYREALATHTLQPQAERHVELNLGLALSWSHHLAQAKATYGALLLHDPRDVDARLGYARALSYEDQLSPALRQYERVLAIDPGNHEALESIARVQSWRGRFRDARERAGALLARDKGDLGASLILAQSKLWMGRPDLAARDERALLESHPKDLSVRSLLDDLADAKSSQAHVSASTGNQSDGLLIRDATLDLEARASQGASSFGIHYEPISYVGQNSNGDAVERRLGVVGRSRFADWGEVNVAASDDDVSATGTTRKDLLLYNTYLTLLPDDTFRFDIGSRKETFDNLTSLALGVTAIYNSLSMDITPDENDRITLRANTGKFTDGNRRGWEQAEVEHAFVRRPRLLFGARGTSYSFSESLNNGYFDPPRYQSAEATGHIYGNTQNRLYYDGFVSYGREWVLNGGARPTHSFHAALSYVVSRPISVSIFADNFDITVWQKLPFILFGRRNNLLHFIIGQRLIWIFSILGF